MKVLFVAGYNAGTFSPFVSEQAGQLRAMGLHVDLFGIIGKGFLGYLKNLPQLLRILRYGEYDLIHAHYGLSAMLAVLQRHIPVVVTFHGSDLYRTDHRRISRWARKRTRLAIYVATPMLSLLPPRSQDRVIPCGIDLELFRPWDRTEACRRLGWDTGQMRVLFAGSFDRAVKNPALARSVMERLPEPVELIELRGWSRQEVVWVMNACDALLLTSHSEGSPQVVKEALACTLPVVSVDVGDIAGQIAGITPCALCYSDPDSLAAALTEVLNRKARVAHGAGDRWDYRPVVLRIIEAYRESLRM